ncbi:MAG TPA: head-tail connector protein [Symbiobacteriaceae bacterium]|jgi:uncharacterized phiE125 gp8 family phage protein
MAFRRITDSKHWSLVEVTPPAVEPLTLAEVKTHLRLDTTDLATNILPVQSIAPGSHGIAASYSLKGAGVNVTGYQAVVVLEAGAFGTGGTVNAKLQESDQDVDGSYVDVVGGAFAQATTANNNATYEMSYTGTKAYVRFVATVAMAACEFGATVIKSAVTSVEDDLLNALITVARQTAELHLRRALITQTWNLVLDQFPYDEDRLTIPLPRLQSIGTISYVNSANISANWDSSNYIVDTGSEPGRLILAYARLWPIYIPQSANSVTIPFTCGYGSTADKVPQPIRQGLKLLISHLYENRETVITGRGMQAIEVPFTVDALWAPYRIWNWW